MIIMILLLSILLTSFTPTLAGITFLIRLFFFGKDMDKREKANLLLFGLSGVATPFVLGCIITFVFISPFQNVIYDAVFGTHNTTQYSNYHDAVTNDKGETKMVYSSEEEVYGARISIKIEDYGRFSELKYEDKNTLIDNTDQTIRPQLVNANLYQDSLCYIQYRNSYHGSFDGNYISSAVMTEPLYVYAKNESTNLIEANTYMQRTSNNQSPFTKYVIFSCSDTDIYQVGFDPCDIRSGCLDGTEFMSSEADSWRIDRKVYKDYFTYKEPVEFEITIL